MRKVAIFLLVGAMTALAVAVAMELPTWGGNALDLQESILRIGAILFGVTLAELVTILVWIIQSIVGSKERSSISECFNVVAFGALVGLFISILRML